MSQEGIPATFLKWCRGMAVACGTYFVAPLSVTLRPQDGDAHVSMGQRILCLKSGGGMQRHQVRQLSDRESPSYKRGSLSPNVGGH